MEQEKSLIPEEQINQPEVLENNETIVTEKPEEQASVNKYIKSVSKDTGVNFFDLC